MSNPAHLWLTDENGSPVIGPSLLPARLGSFEIRNVNHTVWVPESPNTGRLTGTRVHRPLNIHKEFDSATPILYRAMCEGRTFKSAMLKMYKTLDQGMESEYFNIIMENVRIASISPLLHPAGITNTHLEDIHLRYEKITWKYCEGNIMYKDEWNNRATY
ncbi:Major exported protein [compost metagenome]